MTEKQGFSGNEDLVIWGKETREEVRGILLAPLWDAVAEGVTTARADGSLRSGEQEQQAAPAAPRRPAPAGGSKAEAGRKPGFATSATHSPSALSDRVWYSQAAQRCTGVAHFFKC